MSYLQVYPFPTGEWLMCQSELVTCKYLQAKDNLARSKSSRDDKLSKENSSSGIKSTKDKKAQSERYKPKEERQSRARKEYPPEPSRETASLSYGDVGKKLRDCCLFYND